MEEEVIFVFDDPITKRDMTPIACSVLPSSFCVAPSFNFQVMCTYSKTSGAVPKSGIRNKI